MPFLNLAGLHFGDQGVKSNPTITVGFSSSFDLDAVFALGSCFLTL